jgi:Na+/proline symporter
MSGVPLAGEVYEVMSGRQSRRRARWLYKLRRISVIVGVACIAIAVAMLLTTTVGYDGHVETIDGQRNTNGIFPQLGLLCLGGLLLAFGLP